MKIIYLAVSGIALLARNVASAETKPVNTGTQSLGGCAAALYRDR